MESLAIVYCCLPVAVVCPCTTPYLLAADPHALDMRRDANNAEHARGDSDCGICSAYR